MTFTGEEKDSANKDGPGFDLMEPGFTPLNYILIPVGNNESQPLA